MIRKLIDGIVKKDSPIVVGLDPTLALIPEHIKKNSFNEFGETFEAVGDAIWRYNLACSSARRGRIQEAREALLAAAGKGRTLLACAYKYEK